MQVVDTDTLARQERAEAMAATLADATGATALTHEGPPQAAYLRMDQWQVGPSALVRAACSGHTQTRASRHPSRDDEPVVVIGVQHRGGGVQVQDDLATPLAPGCVYGLVLSGAYRHVSTGDTLTSNLLVRAGELQLPLELVHRARPRLAASPVSRLVRAHVRHLVTVADDLDAQASLDVVAPATIQLVRALVGSASGERARLQEALEETLVARVRDHVREHLSDRNLGAATIAAAHHVSVRQLYKACAADGLRLEPWIIARRLEAARDDLARPSSRNRTIAAVAARWGFANSSHFTHRFRERYGTTPREWQHLAHQRAAVASTAG